MTQENPDPSKGFIVLRKNGDLVAGPGVEKEFNVDPNSPVIGRRVFRIHDPTPPIQRTVYAPPTSNNRRESMSTGYVPSVDATRAGFASTISMVLIGLLATGVGLILIQIFLQDFNLWITLISIAAIIIPVAALEVHVTRSDRVEVVDVGGIHARILRPGSHLLIRGLESIPSRNRADQRVQILKTFAAGPVTVELANPGDRAVITRGQAAVKVGNTDEEILMYLFGVAGGKAAAADAATKIYEDGIQSHIATFSLNEIRTLFGDSLSGALGARVGPSIRRHGFVHVGYTFGSADEGIGTRQRRDTEAARNDFFRAWLAKAKEMAFVSATDEQLQTDDVLRARVEERMTAAKEALLQTTLFAAMREGDFTGFTNIGDLISGITGRGR